MSHDLTEHFLSSLFCIGRPSLERQKGFALEEGGLPMDPQGLQMQQQHTLQFQQQRQNNITQQVGVF